MNGDSRLYCDSMAGRPAITPAPPFGAKLAELRKLRGLTQPQLAQALDVSLDMLIYYERRAKNPSTDFVKKAAAFFNVSADELLGHVVQSKRKSGPPSALEQRLAAVRQLPREKQKLVLQVIDTFLRDAQNVKAA
jgi:transcriptional regulator with XRE-family HTH domain